MRANMQAAKLGYPPSPVAASFPASVHAFPPPSVSVSASAPVPAPAPAPAHPNLEALGFVGGEKARFGSVQLGDEEKMPLIQRMLAAKMGCGDQVGVERDIVSEAMGHL